MTLIKHQKIIGYGLIASGLPFFFFFFLMLTPVLMRPEGLAEGEIFYILQIFFFDTASMVFHYPGFALIILGIVLIIKSV